MKARLYLVLVVLFLAAVACVCGDTGTSAVPSVSGDGGAAPPAATSVPAIGTSRDNPAPVGETVSVPNFAILVTAITRPADDIVATGNMFNTEPEPGQEYIMVELSATCLVEECSFSTFNFNVIDSSGLVHDAQSFVSGVTGMLDSGDMLSGGTRSGSVFFLVPQGDDGLVLRWDPFVGDEIFFSMQ